MLLILLVKERLYIENFLVYETQRNNTYCLLFYYNFFIILKKISF